MFSNKFNPDVINIYETKLINRNNCKYDLKNIPYKLILNDEQKKIKTPEDLIIKTHNEVSNKSAKNIEDKYKLVLEERNIKVKDKEDKKIIKDNFQLKEINLNEEYIDDFVDIKNNFISEFKNKESEIKKDRDKFNSILDSLLSDGLLD
jgi:hypothetical protein